MTYLKINLSPFLMAYFRSWYYLLFFLMNFRHRSRRGRRHVRILAQSLTTLSQLWGLSKVFPPRPSYCHEEPKYPPSSAIGPGVFCNVCQDPFLTRIRHSFRKLQFRTRFSKVLIYSDQLYQFSYNYIGILTDYTLLIIDNQQRIGQRGDDTSD